MTPSRRIRILGERDELGIELEFLNACDVSALGRDMWYLSRPETIHAAVAEVHPNIVLNAAAYTAVDRAESGPRADHESKWRSAGCSWGRGAEIECAPGVLLHPLRL